MQEECLWISDPKAIHRILQGSGYLYEKPPITMELSAMLSDMGIISAEGALPSHRITQLLTLGPGDAHKRQRRAMTPAFGLVEAKGLYPYFSRCSNSVGHSLYRPFSTLNSNSNILLFNSLRISGKISSQTLNRNILRSSTYTPGSAKQRLMRTSPNQGYESHALLTHPESVLAQGLLIMTSALWKTLTTNSQSHTKTWRTVLFLRMRVLS